MPTLRPLLITTSLFGASTAHAEEVVVSPGARIVFSFGDGFKVGLAVDLRVTYTDRVRCTLDGDDSARGVGGFAQVQWIIHDGLRLAAGVHGGIGDGGASIDAELGWAFRWLDGVGAHGLQLGLGYPIWPLDAALDGTLLFAAEPIIEGHVALGARTIGMFGENGTQCIVGRPLRINGEQRLGPVVLGPRRHHQGPGDTRWLDDAREEAASVPAFMMLARDLDRLDAHRLARQARVAAREEVGHARLCAALAGRDLGRSVRALPPAPVPTDTDLTRLVLESWHDGCVGEGTAALEAALEHATTRDPAARAALAQIAHDEAGHAELAWAVLAHLVPNSSRATRDALAHAITTTAARDDAHATTLTHARRRAHRLNYY